MLITVRVPKQLRDEARKYGINISKVVKKALMEEINKRRLKEINELQKSARKIIKKLSKEQIIEAIRETRNEQ